MKKPPVYSGELQKIDGHPCNLIGETKIHYMVMENYAIGINLCVTRA